MARPVLASEQSVQVYFRMILVQILDFDETKQILISNVWKSYVRWKRVGKIREIMGEIEEWGWIDGVL